MTHNTPLSAEDRDFCKKLDAEIWNRSKDRFGATHSFEDRKRPLHSDELNRILWLIESHNLPTYLTSGVYGNLSMLVIDHSDAPQVHPDRLITLGEFHVGIDGLKFDDRFAWMAKFTHSEKNRVLMDFYGLPAPMAAHRYDY